MAAVRSKRTWFWLLCAVAVYLVLWELTQLAGMPAVDRMVRAGMPIDSSYAYTGIPRQVKHATTGPIYYCRATAYAPFLVGVEYGWQSEALRGDGGTTMYFWFFGLTTRIGETEHWAS
jgi:hypothetical protein